MHLAARSDDVDEIEKLVREGHDLDARAGIFLSTPMDVAALCDNPDAIETLVRLGSNAMEMRDFDGSTPIRTASVYSRVDALKTLLALGESPSHVLDVEHIPTEDEAHEIRWRVYFRESFVQKLLREVPGEHL